MERPQPPQFSPEPDDSGTVPDDPGAVPGDSGAEPDDSGAEPADPSAGPAGSGRDPSVAGSHSHEPGSESRKSEDGPRPIEAGPVFLHESARAILRKVAVGAIEHGLSCGRPPPAQSGSYPSPLEEPGAVFVTLKSRGRLRGCIGSTAARRSLLEDVTSNAYAAAFQDPRFRPLRPEELPGLEIHISLLTPQVPIGAETREELLRCLRPGIDGVLLEDPPHRATFLPQVWEALPQPSLFLEELLLKAGLPRNHWSRSLRFYRYTVEEI